MAITTRVSLIVADTIVIAVTWRKTFLQYKKASQLGMHTNISATLLRDGEFTHRGHGVFNTLTTYMDRKYLLHVSLGSLSVTPTLYIQYQKQSYATDERCPTT